MFHLLPNILSVLRLFLTPWICWAIIKGHTPLAFVILALALITDVLDGWLARRFHWKTPQGQILDPLADKVFITGLFLSLAYKGLIPMWLAVIVLLRDLGLLIGGIVLWYRRKEVLPAGNVGKLNTLVQIMMGGMAIARWPCHWIIGLMLLTLLFSSWLYGRQAFKMATSS